MTSSVFTTSSSLASETAYGAEDPFVESGNNANNDSNSNNNGNYGDVNGPAVDRGGRLASVERSSAMLRLSKALHGRNVNISPSGLVATRAQDTWSHGLVCAFDADPLVPGRSVLVRLQQHSGDQPQALVGGLNIAAVDEYDRLFHLIPSSPSSIAKDGGNGGGIGVAASNQNWELPPYLCPDLEKRLGSGVWTECLSGDLLSDGCRLWICYGYDYDLHYFINNNYCGRLFSHYVDSNSSNPNSPYLSVAQHFNRKAALIGVNNVLLKRHPKTVPSTPELWLIFDLYGSTTGIELLATADGVNSPGEVFVGGQDAIQSYAEACQTSGILPETDMPIVFIGPPQSGKTVICNALGSGHTLNPSILEGTPFASQSGLVHLSEQNQELSSNNLTGSLNLQDSEQWSGAYLCSECIRMRPKRKKSHGVFLGGPKSSDHLLRMSVSAAQNLALQALTRYEQEMRSADNKSLADNKSTPLEEDIISDMSKTPRLPCYLPPNVVASTPNDLLLLAQTIFDEILLADESGNNNPTSSLVRSLSRTSSTTSMRRRAGCIGLSYRLCDLAVKSPISYWLSSIMLLPKAVYVVAFDLTRIEPNNTLINEVNSSTTPTSTYLDELSIWLELLYLRHSESNHFSPWSAPIGNEGQHDDIFDPNSGEAFLPSVVLVGTRADRLASHQSADTLRNIVARLKYVVDWFSCRPLFRHVVGITAFVPTMVLPQTVTTCLGANAPIIPSTTIPSVCGISLLRKTLEAIARQQPTTKNFIPKRWVDLDEVIADLAAGGLTFLTTEQLRTLASDANIATDSELATYVRYSHSMGRLHYATASIGSSSHLQESAISDGIVFVNPHSLANVIGSSLVSVLRAHEQEGESLPPLFSEDRLHATFQKQQTLAEQNLQNKAGGTNGNGGSNQLNTQQQVDLNFHRQLRWVTWLLNKFDIATPWLLRPNENAFRRKFILLPLIPNKLTSSSSSSAELQTLLYGSPLFTFYIDFKSTSTDFLYLLFLCRCLRWAVSRANQHQQQQHEVNTSPNVGRRSDASASKVSYSALAEQTKSLSDLVANSASNTSGWTHQLSRTVSYIRIDEPTSPSSSSLVIVIANQIAQYNRIKISIRALSKRTNEEPVSTTGMTVPLGGVRKEGTVLDNLQPDPLQPLHRTYSDSKTLSVDAETSLAVNQQAILSILNDLRKCVLRAFGDLQTSMFHRLSFQLSVACPCMTTKCALHDKLQCTQEACVHLISLSECLTNACVTCEFDGRTNTAPIRAWFPSVVMPACTIDEESDQSPILPESILVDTFDNIELHKGNLIPQWLKSAAKLMNIEDAMDDNEGDDSDSDESKGWVELARLLGYHESAVHRFADDVNSSLALLCDWIITAGNNQLAIDVLLSYLEQMGRQDVVGAIRAGRRTPKTVQVFVSYQYDTQADVRALCEWLQVRGYTYWLDDAQMSAGDQLAVEIERAIRNCRVFLACLSPRYLVSQHCHREIWLADLLNKPIIPIVFEKIPWPPPGPLGLVLARLVYVDMKGVGGHGGGGLEADFLGRLSQVIDIVAGYMPHSATPNGRMQQNTVLSALRARSGRRTSAVAESIRSRSLIGTDPHNPPAPTGGTSLAVRVQSCTGCSLM